MYLLLFLMVGIGAIIVALPCFCAWWLTKKLPIWWRLLIVTFLLAVAITPVGGGSEGGPWVATLGLQLPFTLLDPTERVSMHQLLSIEAVTLALGIWVGLYALSAVAIAIRRMILRDAKNASEETWPPAVALKPQCQEKRAETIHHATGLTGHMRFGLIAAAIFCFRLTAYTMPAA